MMQKMYYYTSTDTMKEILTNANIFATNLEYMNDAQEYTNGLEQIKKLLCDKEAVANWKKSNPRFAPIEIDEQMVKERLSDDALKNYRDNPTRYSISFCKEKDLLSQWTTYAKESGVSIEMEFELERDTDFLAYKIDTKVKKRTEKMLSRPKPIVYYTRGRGKKSSDVENQLLTQIFEGAENESLEEYISSQWYYISNFVKVYDFYQENEYRLLFDISNNLDIRIDYRMDKHVIKPYLDLEFPKGWPITEIIVGPGFNQAIVYKSVLFFLNHASVKTSAVSTQRQLKKQIESFFKGESTIQSIWNVTEPTVLRETEMGTVIWKMMEELRKLDNDNETDFKLRYRYRDLVNKAVEELTGMKEVCSEYFKNSSYTLSGIILSCSSIPYIY